MDKREQVAKILTEGVKVNLNYDNNPNGKLQSIVVDSIWVTEATKQILALFPEPSVGV